MKIIILAAGRGSRLDQFTEKKPKCMVKINEYTILDNIINAIKKNDLSLNNVSIVTGYKKEKISIDHITYFHNDLWNKTEIFYSLYCAKEWLEKNECIIIYSDIYFDYTILNKIINSKADILIPYYTEYWDLWNKRLQNPYEDLESFITNNNKLKDIGKKIKSKKEVNGQFMGIVKTTPKGWNTIIKELYENDVNYQLMDMTSVLQLLVENNIDIYTLPISDNWFEFDTENDIKLFNKLIKK